MVMKLSKEKALELLKVLKERKRKIQKHFSKKTLSTLKVDFNN